ncbi:hypothetical protein, partial [Vibrio vulnificus]|uniref:hypothetical protein n=1 Tax=Vibrio vulnificus TaxID=672 RepID=UPI0019D44A07
LKFDDLQRVDATDYRSLLGCLLYLTVTRPDIMFFISKLVRFMSSPSKNHLRVDKRVLMYKEELKDMVSCMKETHN